MNDKVEFERLLEKMCLYSSHSTARGALCIRLNLD